MARIGVDYATVKQAALKLLSQGISPSVQKIRELLGTGSHTTLADHLNQWREEYAKKAVHYLPATLPPELISAVEVLWQAALEHSEKQLAAVKQELDERRQQLQQEKLATDQAVAHLKDSLLTTQHALKDQTEALHALQTELALTQDRFTQHTEDAVKLQKKHDLQVKQLLEEKQTALEKGDQLQSGATQLQHQFTEQAQHHQTLMTQERALQEASEKRWLNLIDQARLETKQLRKESTLALGQYQTQIESLRQTFVEAQHTNATLQATQMHQETVIIKLHQQLQEAHAQLTDKTTQLAVLQSSLEKRSMLQHKQPIFEGELNDKSSIQR